MAYFQKDFLKFFKDLSANNNREWFLENKSRFEDYVKVPMMGFTNDLIKAISKFDKSLDIEAKDAIFRINKDIRFSKDKTPYKTNTSALVARGGRKSIGASGVYVELGPEKLGLAGGVYMPEKEALASIREAIAKNPKSFMKLLEEDRFASVWGELQGEKNKVLPAEFKKAAETCPYIYNKQFYYWVELDPKIIVSDALLETIVAHYKASQKVGKWLSDAIS